MGQQVSITELKEQIEAAKRSLAEMPPVITAADPLFQPVAIPAANFAGLAGAWDDAPDAQTKIWLLMMIWLQMTWPQMI